MAKDTPHLWRSHDISREIGAALEFQSRQVLCLQGSDFEFADLRYVLTKRAEM